MPLEGERLVVEPSYPYAEGLMKIGAPQGRDEQITVRNCFWSSHKRSEIIVYQDKDDRVVCGLVPGVHHLEHDLKTLGCADAWGVEQETTALELLSTLVSKRAFRQYMMTGTFVESSARSGVTYMFRRLKPTVAMHAVDGSMRVLCCLCLHPIAYYSGSWAGAMCPTDDLIAHLMLMRGDEPMFWRRASQHAAYRPEAGL